MASLKLKVNTEKSQVVKIPQSQLLGFCFKSEKVQWHAKKVLHKFKQAIRTQGRGHP